MDISEESLALHYKLRGKLEVVSRYPIQTQKDLSLAYTPGWPPPLPGDPEGPPPSPSSSPGGRTWWLSSPTARRCWAWGTSAPGGMPVMEGKCVLFKEFAGGRFPLCVDTATWTRWWKPSPGSPKASGGINLEDISAPRCFEVERRLKGGLRHPRLPRRPARHRRGDAGRPHQRPEGGRQEERGT